MLVQDVMITNVLTARTDDSVRSIAGTICTNKVSGLPVVDDDNVLVGVVSEKDILNSLLPSYSEFLLDPIRGRDFEGMENSYKEVLSKTVGDLMTPRAFSVSPDDPLMKAASQMALHKFRRIPVVGPGNKLVGIVSLGDIHKAIFKRELDLKG
ncbi:MAG: CBS domain-containing protein [Magnetococcales bacterium]|nr:CBS domain-containing protein [Magnetococcales bacterium]